MQKAIGYILGFIYGICRIFFNRKTLGFNIALFVGGFIIQMIWNFACCNALYLATEIDYWHGVVIWMFIVGLKNMPKFKDVK